MTLLQNILSPLQPINTIRDTYIQQQGIPEYGTPPLDTEHDLLAAMIYDECTHETRQHPILKKSYTSLRKHVLLQYHDLIAHGYTFFPASNIPATSQEIHEALDKFQRLHYSPTQEPHQYLTRAVDTSGHRVTMTDIFSCVHTVFSHGAGYDQSFLGTKGAWLNHRSALPKSAHLALWNETRGRSAWKYAGPHMRIPDYQGFYDLLPTSDPRYTELSKTRVPKKAVLAPDTFV